MSMNHSQPAIIFDFGGVLVNWDPHYLYRPFFDGDDAAIDRFMQEIGFHEWNLQQDGGRSFDEGVAVLSKQFPQYAHFDPRLSRAVCGLDHRPCRRHRGDLARL